MSYRVRKLFALSRRYRADSKNWHAGFSCPGKRLQQFQFVFGLLARTEQTDGRTDGRVDKTRNATCWDSRIKWFRLSLAQHAWLFDVR